VATVLRSTMQRIYNEVRTARMDEYDCHTVLVTSLPQARIACAHCQGQVIDVRSPEQADSGYPSAYLFGYGTPGGHRGVNCRHKWIPFIPGVSTNNQPQYDPDRAIENGKIEQGRKALAGRIRNTKKKLMVAESLGADNIDKYRQQLDRQRAQMRDLVKENGLHRIYRLEKVYTPKQSVLDGGYQAVLTKAEKKRASEQYDRYRSILGDKAPKSLDDYINLKYNSDKEYNLLKHDARIVKYFKGKIDEDLSEYQKKQAVKAYFNFKKDGILFGDHGIARYVQSMRRGNGAFKYNYSTVVDLFNQIPLYTSTRDGKIRDVRFNKNVIIYSEQGTKEVVSMILRSSKKKEKDVPHKDWTVIKNDSDR
ncbi:capsid protein, partial [Turicibacter sanguinis]|nr:capsid protein [Turicibacter sanguinis]